MPDSEQSNQDRLIAEILARSTSPQWPEARKEWVLSEIYREKEPLTCLCGFSPIQDICILRNRINGNLALLGKLCADRFSSFEASGIFSGLQSISCEPARPLNKAATLFAHARRWITDWERDFLFDTARRRRLSLRQLSKREEINRRILARTTNTFKNRRP